MIPAALASGDHQIMPPGAARLCAVATVRHDVHDVRAIRPLKSAPLTRERGVWLAPSNAAYGGTAAILPEFRWLLDGAPGRSLVVNPAQVDACRSGLSVALRRDLELLRRNFALVSDRSGHARPTAGITWDYGLQLGRRSSRVTGCGSFLRTYGVRRLSQRNG